MSNAEKRCELCKYAGLCRQVRGDRCDGCLEPGNGPYGYAYLNFEAGNPVAFRLDQERAGNCPIVIGGVGEAEVYANRPMKESLEQLRSIAEDCGYMVGKSSPSTLEVSAHGNYTLHYTPDGASLVKIVNSWDKVIWSMTDAE